FFFFVSTSTAHILYLLSLLPVNIKRLPSGDQPCRYEWPAFSSVIFTGLSDPETGSTNTVEVLFSPTWWLMPNIFPSKESTWSLLFWFAKPVFSFVILPVASSYL